jgi:hypothetical protein
MAYAAWVSWSQSIKSLRYNDNQAETLYWSRLVRQSSAYSDRREIVTAFRFSQPSRPASTLRF